MKRHPIISLVGSSRSGKSTLIHEMVRFFPGSVGIVKSITTRDKRGPEDDANYDEFVSFDEMERRRVSGRLIQVSEYVGQLYANDREHVNRLLDVKIGICALVEQGVINLQEAGYDVRVVYVVPVNGGEVSDEARRKADEQRALYRLDAALTIENSFAPGGLEKASRKLSDYIVRLMREAR